MFLQSETETREKENHASHGNNVEMCGTWDNDGSRRILYDEATGGVLLATGGATFYVNGGAVNSGSNHSITNLKTRNTPFVSI